MKIGIFSGIFDPFTVAHYEIVREAVKHRLVDKVIVVPAVDKSGRSDKDIMFNLAERQRIINRWFNDFADVILDFSEYSCERLREGRRSYMDILKHVSSRYNGRGDNILYTILGTDEYYDIKSLNGWKDIIKASNLIVVQRDGACSELYRKVSDIPYQSLLLDNRFLSISSSKIRERLGRMCESMSMGPAGLPINVYLDEIDDYKKNGRTFEETERILEEASKKIDRYLKEHKEKVTDIMNKNNNTIRVDNKTMNEIKTKANVLFKDEDGNELITSTPIFDLVKAPEAEAGFRPVRIKSKDWVTIVVERNGQFLMEKQLRHGLNRTFEEFPCGMVEENEHPMDAALRELKEETGINVHRFTMKYLGKFAANPAFMTNYMHYFHITIDDRVIDQADQQLDEHEHIEWYWADKEKAFENFCESEGSSIAGCCWMLLMKDGILDSWSC